MLEFLYSELSIKIIYGFGFMFFTLLVASISDIKMMFIKKSFMYMWIVFAVVMFLYEYTSQISWIKWILIVSFGLLSWRGIGKIFSLARADVIAIAAVSSLLTVPQLLLFYVILILVNKVILYPIALLNKMRYPFIPVIWISLTFLIIILGVLNWNFMEIIDNLFSLLKL